MIGIIGYKGRAARRHIKAWEALNMPWIGCGKEDDLDSFLDKVDLVDICTPIYLHAPMIKKAVERNLPVICEKPIGLSSKEADEVIALKGKVGIIYQFRFNPKVLKLKKAIEEDTFGEIKLVTVQYYRWRGWEYYQKWEHDKDKAGGGVVLNVCIHYLDLLQWLLGYPKEIYGLTTTSKVGIDVEDNAVAIMRFPNGAIGSVILSTHVNPPKHFEFSVYGTKGHTTIQLRQNEYHKENFMAFLSGENYVDPIEAKKSLRMALSI